MPRDKLGQQISEGDFIVYGHALGRCAGLRIGIVKKIKEPNLNCHVDQKWGFTVRGIDDDWSSYEPTLNMRDGHLMFANRIIVLSSDMLQQKYIDLLRTHYHESKA